MAKQKTYTMDCSRICRLCAEFRPNQQLTALDGPDQRIRTKLLRCSQIDLSLDDNLWLPQNVCGACTEKLEQSWSFAEAVAKAQDKLRIEFAQDPLANIKIEEENAVDSEFQLLTELLAGIKHEDHNYVANRSREEHLTFSNEKRNSKGSATLVETEETDFCDFTLGPSTSFELDEVTVGDVLEPATAKEALIPSISNVYLNYEPMSISIRKTQPLKLKSATDLSIPCAKVFTRDMLRSFYDNNQRDFWEKVTKYFRETFEITDEECNRDGTIDEKAHPDLSQHTWKVHNWKCFKCHKYFSNVLLLESHIENEHHADTFRIEYCCFDCDKQYGLLSSLKNHIYMMHRPELRFW